MSTARDVEWSGRWPGFTAGLRSPRKPGSPLPCSLLSLRANTAQPRQPVSRGSCHFYRYLPDTLRENHSYRLRVFTR
jgi:hypothetical protein